MALRLDRQKPDVTVRIRSKPEKAKIGSPLFIAALDVTTLTSSVSTVSTFETAMPISFYEGHLCPEAFLQRSDDGELPPAAGSNQHLQNLAGPKEDHLRRLLGDDLADKIDVRVCTRARA